VSERRDQIHGDGPTPQGEWSFRVNDALFQSSQSDQELDRRAGFEPLSQRPFLIDDAVDAPGMRVHDDYRSGVGAQRGEDGLSDFRIFASEIIALNRHLTRAANRRL
jgi:hypothetical protein